LMKFCIFLGPMWRKNSHYGFKMSFGTLLHARAGRAHSWVPSEVTPGKSGLQTTQVI
jgi:hypothetical protein